VKLRENIAISHLADERSSACMHGHVSRQVVVGVELFAALRTNKRFRRSFVVVTRLVVVARRRCWCCRRTGRPPWTFFHCPSLSFHLEQRLD